MLEIFDAFGGQSPIGIGGYLKFTRAAVEAPEAVSLSDRVIVQAEIQRSTEN